MVNVARQDLNRVQYSGLDFDTLNDDLLARLQVQFAADFNDFALSSMGIVLLDLVSFGLDTLSFYLDRRATDNFLQTARTRASVSRLTRQLGYKMGAAVASSTDLMVAILAPVGFPVPIPEKTQFQGPNGLIFESAKAVSFAANADVTSPQQIPVYEGETITESFVSDGTSNQVFTLARVPGGKFIVQGTVDVIVDGAAFTESDFITFDATDQFEFAANDDPPTVRFGDGTAGNIPKQGATIAVTYVASAGLAGLVLANTITSTAQPFVVNFQQIQLSITNPCPSVGGDDPETIASAKIFAPQVFKSRLVAITRNDYEALAGSFADPLFGRVAVAQAISSRSAETDLTLQNLLNDIKDAVAANKPTIAAAITAGQAQLAIIATDTTAGSVSISQQLTDLVTLIVQINNENNAATTISRQSKQKTTEIQSNHSEISTRLASASGDVATVQITTNSIQTTVSAIGLGGSDQLTLATQTSLINLLSSITTTLIHLGSVLTQIGSQSSAASSAAGIISTNLTTILTYLGQISDDVVDVGTDLVTSNTKLNTISTLNAAIAAAGVATSAELAAISAANTLTTGDVQTATDEITTHVSAFLSADCKANLVTVPILTKDSSGFFASPSTSLVQSLQAFLDVRKEVTQTVAVTDGHRFLIPAAITVRVAVKKNFAQSVVQNAVAAVVDTTLRDRKFGQSLYVSELDTAIEAVPGIAFWNTRIDGYFDENLEVVVADKLDANGNLILGIGEIITKATVRDGSATPQPGVLITVETEPVVV